MLKLAPDSCQECRFWFYGSAIDPRKPQPIPTEYCGLGPRYGEIGKEQGKCSAGIKAGHVERRETNLKAVLELQRIQACIEPKEGRCVDLDSLRRMVSNALDKMRGDKQ